MRRRFAMTLACSLGGLLALTGCSDLAAQLSDARSSEPVGGHAEPPPPLATESWGTADGLLSVIVRNPTERTLRSATAVITALDAEGEAIGMSRATALACCAVSDLAPGRTYGLYFDVGTDAGTVSDVKVSYRDVAWYTRRAAPMPPPVTVTPVRLTAGPLGAVVVADVATPGTAVAQAVVQAHLVGPDGAFLVVVSGRWTCFAAGGRRRIEMQLFHPVPPGTVVESIVVHPVATPRPAPVCPAP
jgi:hypothetical protein